MHQDSHHTRPGPGHGPLRPAGTGFTLLELLVVVVIIGLLAAYAGPRFLGQIGKSEQVAARAQIEAFHRALAIFRMDTGHLPTTDQGLSALLAPPTQSLPAGHQWRGPYLHKALPNDPWGHAYIYRAPGTRSEYDLLSYGKDGQPGGTGDAADVSTE